MAFRFKKFSVDDATSTMKVGTDSVLLGAWAGLENSTKILDIGTGCGLLALMAAQRSQAEIMAIDIDPAAIDSAQLNISLCQWSKRIEVLNLSLQDYALQCLPKSFDFIISNPPFFINSLKAPDAGRSNARHTDLLPFEMLAAASAKLLTPDGKLSLVLPVNESLIFSKIAEENGLYPHRKMMIIPKQGKPANRVLVEFGFMINRNVSNTTMIIRDLSGEYSREYTELTKDFYLNF